MSNHPYESAHPSIPKRGDAVTNFKRTKQDEQIEKFFEELVSTAWKNKKELAQLSAIFGPVAIGYLWTQQRALLDQYLPTKEIERIAAIYFPKIILLVLFLALLLVIRGVFVAYWNRKTYEYTRILPHGSDGISAENLGHAIRSFHGSKRSPLHRLVFGKERFSYLIHYRDKDIVFYLGAPKDRLGYLKTHLSSLYARIEFHSAEEMTLPKRNAVGGRIWTKRKKQEATLSLARYKHDQLPMLLNNMNPNTYIQICFSPNNGYKLEKEIEKAQGKAKHSKDIKYRTYTDREEIHSWEHRMSGNEVAFDVTVSLATHHHPGVKTLKSTANAINTIMADVNELKYRRWRHAVKFYPSMSPYKMTWTGSELANLVHLPNLNQEGLVDNFKAKIAHNEEGRELLPYNVFSNPLGVLFGYQKHPFKKDREVRVLPRYLGHHWILTGVNGSGKSTLLNQILVSMVDEFLKGKVSPGFSFIDPATDTISIILNYLMTREVWEKQAAEREGREPAFTVDWSKIKWIKFKDADHPPAMNLFHTVEGEDNDLAADVVFRIIQDFFPQAVQTERLLRMCIRTFMADPQEKHTVLGIPQLVNNPEFRGPILQRIIESGENRDIIDFWEHQAEKIIEGSGTALETRLETFYRNKNLRRIFGQKDFNFPIREWMDQGYIIFYDFGGLNEDEVGLIGNYLTYLYYRIADTRDENGDPLLHQLVIDEAHKVPATILPKVVMESRKKGLSLGTVLQDIYKLPPELFDAMTEVTGNYFVCQQGSKNAKLASSFFNTVKNGKARTVYSPTDLQTLPERNAAIRIKDEVNGLVRVYQTVVEVPPLDRYLPSGEVATYGDKEKNKRSKEWTKVKAKELESSEGLHKTEIDRQINKYLYGIDEVQDQKEDVSETTAGEVEQQAEPQKDIFLEAIQENDATKDEQNAEELPMGSSEVNPPSQLDKDEFQQALEKELSHNVTVPADDLQSDPKTENESSYDFWD